MQCEDEQARVGFENHDYVEVLRQHHASSPDGLNVEPEVKALVRRYARGRVLDAGCGEGAMCRWLAVQCPDSRVVGADFSYTGVKAALREGPHDLVYLLANLKELCFRDDAFDFIVCQSVLEHLLRYRFALKEFFRILRPGGHLLIRVSNHRPAGWRFLAGYVFGTTRAIPLVPTFSQRPGNLSDTMTNFDVVEIPSNVLLRQLRAVGFRIAFFTTRRHLLREDPRYRTFPRVVRALRALYWRLPLFPFTHLGPTVIVVGTKRGT